MTESNSPYLDDERRAITQARDDVSRDAAEHIDYMFKLTWGYLLEDKARY
jgi:hypothetical protein